MNTNNNSIDQTMYNFKVEDLNNYTKEQLISNIIEFGNIVVNNRIGTLIELLKNTTQTDPTVVDTDSEEFKSVYKGLRNRFDDCGINNTGLSAVQHCLNASKAKAMKDQFQYESAKATYKKECIKRYALTMLADSYMKCINHKATVEAQNCQLKIAAFKLKKQLQKNKLSTCSISLDEMQHLNIGANVKTEVIDLGDSSEDDGDNSSYNNNVDSYMHEM